MRTRLGISCFIASLASAACSTPTALGNGTFVYECVPATGTKCASGPAIPSSIVVGAHFKLTYTPSDTNAFKSAAVAPVSSDFFSVANGANGEWVALRPGRPAAFATSGGLALDYVFIPVVAQ